MRRETRAAGTSCTVDTVMWGYVTLYSSQASQIQTIYAHIVPLLLAICKKIRFAEENDSTFYNTSDIAKNRYTVLMSYYHQTGYTNFIQLNAIRNRVNSSQYNCLNALLSPKDFPNFIQLKIDQEPLTGRCQLSTRFHCYLSPCIDCLRTGC